VPLGVALGVGVWARWRDLVPVRVSIARRRWEGVAVTEWVKGLMVGVSWTLPVALCWQCVHGKFQAFIESGMCI